MGDAYWRYPDGRAVAPSLQAPPTGAIKRPRTDFPEASVGTEFRGYYPREDERIGQRIIVQDTESIEASYDRYLRNAMPSYNSGESGRPLAGGLSARPVDDPRVMVIGSVDGRNVTYGGGRPEISRVPEVSLPPDASNTLFVEGLPANCSRREASHIFRPFVGFREVRLVNKESRNPGADPLVLCFVDFSTPSQAAVALDALQDINSIKQEDPEKKRDGVIGLISYFSVHNRNKLLGYRFDEHDRDSPNLRIQFARFPGPRSTTGPRGRR